MARASIRKKTPVTGKSVLLLALLLSRSLQAQDYSEEATFGEVSLRGGFLPDPHSVEIQAGGSIDASSLGANCVGNIANAPDFELTFDPGTSPLTFSFVSDGDTTLAINTPDGSWVCDDDSGGGLDPMVNLPSPSSGVYDIWVGTYDSAYLDGSLNISELGTADASGRDSSPPLDTLTEELTATDHVSLDDKYQDFYRFTGSAGQSFTVSLQSSDFDTYLMLEDPNGNQSVNDDFDGIGESRLDITLPEDGEYLIIATTFSAEESGSYTLLTSVPVSSARNTSAPFNGELESGDDTRLSGQFIDTFQFSGEAGTPINVFLGSSELQTYLILEAPSGRIFEDSDLESISQSRLETVLSETGIYNIYVSSNDSGETGQYLLRIIGAEFTEI